MKYIVLIIGLLVVGCGEVENGAYKHRPKQTDTNESTPTTNTNKANVTTVKPVKELTLEEKVVGEYEYKSDKNTYRWIILENYTNGKNQVEAKWSIVNKEIHVDYGIFRIFAYRINEDKSITQIAAIEDGKRTDLPKAEQSTYKKIKSEKATPSKGDDKNSTTAKPVKELTKENIVGTYQMSLPNGLFTMTLQKDGKSIHDRITNSGEKESDTGKWKIEDGNLFLIGEDMTGIMKINPDRSLVPIAEIKNGVRKNLDPKVSSVVSFKKINEKPTKELTKEEVVGTYEGKGEGTVKMVLHENEKVEVFENGNKFLEGTWKMVGKETHLDCKSIILVIKIEPNGDLASIARIRNSKREEVSKREQLTLKKIK